MSDTIPVHERFHAFQGEGRHLGRNAFFIRTFGCPVHCPWCDSAGTWHKDYVPAHIDRMPIEKLVQEVLSAKPQFVVITGGEPTVQPNFAKLTKAIRDACVRVHVETCGAFEFDKDDVNWVTVSPKREKMPTMDNVITCNELKIIVDHPLAIDEWFATLDSICGGRHWMGGKTVWLHPEWSQRDNPDILNAISAKVKECAYLDDVRAGWQLHKLYKVDSLDPNSKPLVPLGGNPDYEKASRRLIAVDDKGKRIEFDDNEQLFVIDGVLATASALTDLMNSDGSRWLRLTRKDDNVLIDSRTSID